MTIKAIETLYKGYRFRSRLEARWAVFFDALGVKWEYEKQGYALPSGCYLPDFWLPDLNMWVEIKPVSPTAEELSLCSELGHATDRAVSILVGVPGEELMLVYCSDSTDGGGGTEWWDSETGWCNPAPHWSFDQEGGFCICSGNNHSSRSFTSPNWDSWSRIFTVRECCHDRAAANRLYTAYTSARSVRFEHGETPR